MFVLISMHLFSCRGDSKCANEVHVYRFYLNSLRNSGMTSNDFRHMQVFNTPAVTFERNETKNLQVES